MKLSPAGICDFQVSVGFESCLQRLPGKSRVRGWEGERQEAGRRKTLKERGVSPFPCSQAKLAVLLVTLVAATTSYLWMENKLQQGLVPRQPRIPKPQHKVRGYRYLEEDNSDESDVEGEQGQGDCAEEEAPQAGPLGAEPAGPCRRPCPYEQALGGDGPEEQ